MDDERTKVRLLRGIVVAALALGFVAVALALMPGVEVWKDLGRELGWRRVDNHSCAERPVWMLAWGVVMLGPGLLVWFRPQLSYACLWSMIAFGATTMWFVVTADMPARHSTLYVHFVEKWPARWFGYVVVILIGGLVVALPVFCGAFAFVTGRRDGVRATLPTARVIRR